MGETPIPPQTLTQWAREIEERLRSWRNQIGDLNHRLQLAEEKIRLLMEDREKA